MNIKRSTRKPADRRPLFHLPLLFSLFFLRVPGAVIQQDPGKLLFLHNCTRCHGADGARGFLGAKDLKKSMLSDSAIVERIQNGRRIMPSWRKKFTTTEIWQLAAYIKTLRTNRHEPQ
ncbi:MAG TPA: cytochrome c [Puia sp.]|nr:cytochrome c [Puia sp.]